MLMVPAMLALLQRTKLQRTAVGPVTTASCSEQEQEQEEEEEHRGAREEQEKTDEIRDGASPSRTDDSFVCQLGMFSQFGAASRDSAASHVSSSSRRV